nr:MAG TPA: hypothetical protein [Caudoviricetes sp.]
MEQRELKSSYSKNLDYLSLKLPKFLIDKRVVICYTWYRN